MSEFVSAGVVVVIVTLLHSFCFGSTSGKSSRLMSAKSFTCLFFNLDGGTVYATSISTYCAFLPFRV